MIWLASIYVNQGQIDIEFHLSLSKLPFASVSFCLTRHPFSIRIMLGIFSPVFSPAIPSGVKPELNSRMKFEIAAEKRINRHVYPFFGIQHVGRPIESGRFVLSSLQHTW